MRPEATTVLRLDSEGRVEWCDERAVAALGVASDAAVGRHLDELVASADPARADEPVWPATTDGERGWIGRTRVRARGSEDGEPLDLLLFRSDDVVLALLAEPTEGQAVRDLLETVGSRISEGLLVTSPELDDPGPTVLFANDVFAQVLGVAPAEMEGRLLRDFIDPVKVRRLQRLVRQALEQGESSISGTDRLAIEGDAAVSLEWDVAAVPSAEGGVASFVSVQRDTARGGAGIEQLPRREVDPLTGLPNQVYLVSRMGRSVEWTAESRPYRVAVLCLEVDDFADIREEHGTAIGHLLLRAVAWRMGSALRPTDLIARVGDQRLAVLLEQFDGAQDLRSVLDRIRSENAEAYVVGGHRIRVSMNAAAVTVGERHQRAQDVLREAEAALIQSHGRTSDDVAWLDGELVDLPPASAPSLQEALLNAVRERQLTLRYQPLFSLRTGEVVAMEALLRWRHPDRGLMPSASFVQDAQRSGAMIPVGKWVLREACRQIAAWEEVLPGDRVPSVHVNVGVQEFWRGNLVGTVRRSLEEIAVDPRKLRIEVAEDVVARAPDRARAIFRALRERGVDVWLEGFGAGGLPLQSLAFLKLRHVKVDAGTNGARARSNGQEVVAGLIRLAHTLHFETAAGGVETVEQREFLLAERCEYAQGHLFASDLEAEDATALLRAMS